MCSSDLCWGNPVGMVDLDGKIPSQTALSANSDLNTSNRGKTNYSLSDNYIPNTSIRNSYESIERDYTGVIYLNAQAGAAGMGHNAILLIEEGGIGELYSYVGTGSPSAVAGFNDAYVYNAEGIDISTIFQTNDSEIFGFRVKRRDGKYDMDYYNRGIYIPISNDQGMAINSAAMNTMLSVNGRTDGDGEDNYKLLWNNCDDYSRDWLKAGNIYLPHGITPNMSYDKVVETIDYWEQNFSGTIYEGWQYGDLAALWSEIDKCEGQD